MKRTFRVYADTMNGRVALSNRRCTHRIIRQETGFRVPLAAGFAASDAAVAIKLGWIRQCH